MRGVRDAAAADVQWVAGHRAPSGMQGRLRQGSNRLGFENKKYFVLRALCCMLHAVCCAPILILMVIFIL